MNNLPGKIMYFDLNRGWEFQKEDGEMCIVNLPHDAMLTEKRYAACRSGVQGAFFPGGKYHYSKKFSLRTEDIGKSVELLFEGVYRNAEVYVNGVKVGMHKYGYSEFSFDISEVVKGGENSIGVTVDNSLVPNCRWYSGSGIYRPVWLRIAAKDTPRLLQISTKSLSPAVIEVTADEGAEIEIYDGETLIAKGGAGEINIPNAKLWSAETPYLYTAVSRLGGEEMKTSFGIRTIEWNAKEGFLLNGKRTLLRGGCIHHDNGVLGACGFYNAEERRVRILKKQGFNALRISHNPVSRAFLDACDKLGMYVIDECFDGWYIPKDYHDYSRDFWKGYRDDLRAMVKKDYNHPCVVMYSVGNEVTETASEKGVKLCAEIRDLLHYLDATRPVTCGINVLLNVYVRRGMGVYKDKGIYERKPLPEGKGFREKKSGSAFFNYWACKLGKLMFLMSKGRMAEKIVASIAPALDIVGLNYASSRYDIDANKYPSRMMVGSETMAGDLPYNWARVKKYPQLIGDFVWAAWDYLGEACIGDWTYYSYKGLPLLAGQGMIDITGFVKAQMYFMQVVWGLRKQPFLCVRPLNHCGERPKKGAWQFTDAIDSWNWQGCEGKKTVAEVYADAYAVQLFLNGKKVGEKRIKKYKALFSVRYASGTLTAVALDERGKELSRTSLQTGGRETFLRVTADKTVLRADGQDLCFAEIEFVDENGNLKPFIEQPVEIALLGKGAALQGFGSALCKTDETFSSPRHHSYRGRALAVFRAGFESGKLQVTVTSAGVVSQTFEIEVKHENSLQPIGNCL